MRTVTVRDDGPRDEWMGGRIRYAVKKFILLRCRYTWLKFLFWLKRWKWKQRKVVLRRLLCLRKKRRGKELAEEPIGGLRGCGFVYERFLFSSGRKFLSYWCMCQLSKEWAGHSTASMWVCVGWWLVECSLCFFLGLMSIYIQSYNILY